MEKIKHPSHYAEGRKYEPYKVIKDWDLNFNLGNAVKYISRAGRKDNAVEDLRKAMEYIQFELEAIEGEQGEILDRIVESFIGWMDDMPYNIRGNHFRALKEIFDNLEKADKVREELSEKLGGYPKVNPKLFVSVKGSEPVSLQVILEGGYIPTEAIDEVVDRIADRIRQSLHEVAEGKR